MKSEKLTMEDLMETGRIVFGLTYDERDSKECTDSRVILFAPRGSVQRVQAVDRVDGDAER